MHRPHSLLIVLASGLAASAAGQTVLNGDLTGAVGTGSVPTDWFAWSGSTDTCDTGGPFNNTGNPWVLSPNGGTFVRGGATGTGVNEAIAQNLTGFTPGQTYTVDFYVTNLGFQQPGALWTGADGFWKFYIDGTDVGDSGTYIKPALASDDIVWSADAVTFVAPAAGFELAVASQWAGGPGTAAYMGIDGIRISPVPAPASMALIGLGGLVASRRRRG